MLRSTFLLIVFGFSLLLAASGRADTRTTELLSATEARRFGLELAWTTRVEVDAARGRVTHIQQFISSRNNHTYYEVQYGEGERRRVFGEQDLDRFGEVVGQEGARRLAEQFIRQLEARGLEAEIEEQQVPEITLYVTTDRAMVHAINAETGRTVWATVVGNPDFPTERVGVGEDYVAVLNGSSLYLLQRDTGRLIWTRRTYCVPAAGPAITPYQVVVPTYSGRVELYDLEETETLPDMHQSNGRAVIQPVVTPLSVAWPTDRGLLYVASVSRARIRFRLEARDAIVSQPAFFHPNRLFVGSVDGYLYCLHETSGDQHWRFSAGEAVVTTPVPTGDSLFFLTDQMNLYHLGQQTGELRWIAPYVSKFLAASKDRLYCLGMTDRLEILDRETGSRIATTQSNRLSLFYANPLTDRIIVGMDTGMLQAYREVDQRWPLVHVGEVTEEPAKKRPAIKQEALPEREPERPQPGRPDPFDTPVPADPFGAPDDPAADPFGPIDDADDPFGGGAAPFGGQDDPFGG